jgi:hypothetical protein
MKEHIIEEFLKVLDRYEPDLTPRVRKTEQLNMAIKRAGFLIKVIDEMEGPLRAKINTAVDTVALRELLTRFSAAVVQFVPALPDEDEPEDTGPEEIRYDFAKKKLAAEYAYAIMVFWCGMELPPTTGGVKFKKLTGFLYHIATGDDGDVGRACKEFMRTRSRHS